MLHSFPWTSFWSVLLAAGLLWEQTRQATAVGAGRGVCCETRFITLPFARRRTCSQSSWDARWSVHW